jgi:hypothetical protein
MNSTFVNSLLISEQTWDNLYKDAKSELDYDSEHEEPLANLAAIIRLFGQRVNTKKMVRNWG